MVDTFVTDLKRLLLAASSDLSRGSVTIAVSNFSRGCSYGNAPALDWQARQTIEG